MNRIIGDRREKSALDKMEEVARQRNRDVAEEDRLEAQGKVKRKEEPFVEKPAKNKIEPLAAEVPVGPIIPIPAPSSVIHMAKARNIADTVEKEIGFIRRPEHSMGYRLYKCYPNSTISDTCYTADNAAMAMLNSLIRKKDEYSETMEGINKSICRKSSFWRSKPAYYNFCDNPLENKVYSLEANAMMAILHIAKNDRDIASQLVRIIEKKTKKTDALLRHNGEISTTENALMAIIYESIGDTARAENMKQEIFYKNLHDVNGYYLSDKQRIVSVRANASMAILNIMLGNIQRAEAIINIIELYGTKVCNSALFKNTKADNSWPVYTNALVGCAHAMLGGGKLF